MQVSQINQWMHFGLSFIVLTFKKFDLKICLKGTKKRVTFVFTKYYLHLEKPKNVFE